MDPQPQGGGRPHRGPTASRGLTAEMKPDQDHLFSSLGGRSSALYSRSGREEGHAAGAAKQASASAFWRSILRSQSIIVNTLRPETGDRRDRRQETGDRRPWGVRGRANIALPTARCGLDADGVLARADVDDTRSRCGTCWRSFPPELDASKRAVSNRAAREEDWCMERDASGEAVQGGIEDRDSGEHRA